MMSAINNSIDNSTVNNEKAIALAQLGRWLAARNWVPATGGNFSIRLSPDSCLVSASGKDKGSLSESDCLHIQWSGSDIQCQGKPSDETLLHTKIYDLDQAAACVLHTHSVSATVLGRLSPGDSLTLTGYEMQKSITGQSTHEGELILPILANTQNMTELALAVDKRWQQGPFSYAFLVRGHGLYVWGKDEQTAQRHLEGWEFLLSCELERLRIGKPYVS